MSWRAVAVIYAVLGLLLIVVLPLGPAPTVEDAPPPEAAPERSLLGIESSAVQAVLFRRGDLRVRAVREDGRWRTVEPAGATVPSDLVDAAVATLTAGQVSPVVTEGRATDDLTVFGLAVPSSEIVLTKVADAGGGDIRVVLGERNPTKTAVYARRGDDPRVYLVGLNVRYYEDLIFEAAAPRAAG
jgi:hypothetical protein